MLKPARREWLAHSALGLVLFASYLTISRLPTVPIEVFMPRWVPFLPWLAVPYLLQLVISWFLLLAIRDRALRRACLMAYLASIALTSVTWVLHPTVMLRPPVSSDWWNWPYRVMIAADRPTNILPCGHILMPVVITWAFAIERPRWLWWLVPCQLLGAVAIVTSWQHRPVDLAIGVGLAIACGLSFGIRPKPTVQPAVAPSRDR